MQRRSMDEINAMTYREYKIDVWTRLANAWTEMLGSSFHDQAYVKSKIARCKDMAAYFASPLRL